MWYRGTHDHELTDWRVLEAQVTTSVIKPLRDKRSDQKSENSSSLSEWFLIWIFQEIHHIFVSSKGCSLTELIYTCTLVHRCQYWKTLACRCLTAVREALCLSTRSCSAATSFRFVFILTSQKLTVRRVCWHWLHLTRFVEFYKTTKWANANIPRNCGTVYTTTRSGSVTFTEWSPWDADFVYGVSIVGGSNYCNAIYGIGGWYWSGSRMNLPAPKRIIL